MQDILFVEIFFKFAQNQWERIPTEEFSRVRRYGATPQYGKTLKTGNLIWKNIQIFHSHASRQ